MSKFLMQVSFTKDGVKGLAKEGGTKRRQAVEQFFATVGGKLEALYFAFGDPDVFAVADFPDHVSAGLFRSPQMLQERLMSKPRY